MNHHQRKILHAIFAHPVNANLEMKWNGLAVEIFDTFRSNGVTRSKYGEFPCPTNQTDRFRRPPE